MRIGAIEVGKGEKAFCKFCVTETRGRFTAHIPIHVVEGSTTGPTLLVQAGVSGLEIEPAMILPKIIQELDPMKLAGTLLMVPLLNTSGFEFEQVNAAWDDKDLNALGRGRADGTISEKMIHAYYEQVLAKADAVLDIHTGALWGYYRYAGVYKTGQVEKSKEFAISLGLPQVLLGQPEDRSMAQEAASDGKTVATAWIGGGPGLRDFREQDSLRVQNAILNAMRYLGMLEGKIEYEEKKVTVLDMHTVLKTPSERGFVFVAKEKRGCNIKAGEIIGYVKHPFTGDIIQEIASPREGIMLHAGTVLPLAPEGSTLAIFGDPVEERDVS